MADLGRDRVAVFWDELVDRDDPGRESSPDGARSLHDAARTLLRRSLSRYAAVEPERWRFETRASGKPEIGAEFGTDLQFSLSHTRGCVACAVGCATRVGVDVERVDRDVRFEDIPAQFFAPREQAWISRAPPAERRIRFLRVWTLKEALLKALGVGLGGAMDQCAFDVEPVIVAELDPALCATGQWQFDQRTLAGGFIVAVAANRAPVSFDYERIRLELA